MYKNYTTLDKSYIIGQTTKMSMEDLTIFRKIYGDSSYICVLDFFLDNDVYDYSKSVIARESGISRVTLEPILQKLSSLGIIKQTRRNGMAKMYKLNKENEVAMKLLDFYIELAFMFAPKSPEDVKVPIKS